MNSIATASGILLVACVVTDRAKPPTQRHYLPGCTFLEKTAAACGTIRESVLRDAEREPLSASLTPCSMLGLYARVSWQTKANPARSYNALVKFTADNEGEALHPVHVEPLIFEWPLSPNREPGARELVSRVRLRCQSSADVEREVRVAIPPITQASCVAESRVTAGTSDWCRQTPSGDSFYRMRRFDPFAHALMYTIRVDLWPGRATVTVNNRSVDLADGPLRALFEPTWDMPSEAEESCRDGSLTVVEARRASAWKAILRYCHSPVDFSAFQNALAGTTLINGAKPRD